MKCPHCGNEKPGKNGKDRNGSQKYHCLKCGKHFNADITSTPLRITKSKSMGISVDEFLRENDIQTQVREAVKKLQPGTLFKRAQFVDEFNISKTSGYVDVLDSDEFAEYRGNVNNSLQYFGHPEDIKALKAKRLLK